MLPEFEAEVKSIFEGKSIEELNHLEKEITTSVQSLSYSASEELSYWEAMLKRLSLFKGDAVLKGFYQYFMTVQKDNPMDDALEIEVFRKIKPSRESLLAKSLE